MNDRPTADELLEAVREYLLSEVAPAAPSHRARFRALIAANVIAIVRRELAARDGQEELTGIAELLGVPALADPGGDLREGLLAANRRIAEHIREGAADEGDHARAVRDLIRKQVEGKLAVNNPAFLERFETQGQ